MLCTANYEARKYGVTSAMPGYIARKLCPQLLIVGVDFEKYSKYGAIIRRIFRVSCWFDFCRSMMLAIDRLVLMRPVLMSLNI